MKDAADLCFGAEIRSLLFEERCFSQKEEEIHPKVGFFQSFFQSAYILCALSRYTKI